MLSDSAVGATEADEQPLFVSDLQAREWMLHPETRLLYHASESEIQVYYNANKHILARTDEVLHKVRQLCAQREWSASLVNACVDIEALEKLLLEMASNAAIMPIDED